MSTKRALIGLVTVALGACGGSGSTASSEGAGGSGGSPTSSASGSASTSSSKPSGSGSSSASDSSATGPIVSPTGGVVEPEQFAELWYSVDQVLVRIELDAANGAVKSLVPSALKGAPPLGQNAITMLKSGALLGARLEQATKRTAFYYVAEPPRDGADVTPVELGEMPGGLMIEGLYTDCDGRVYAMDSGVNDTNAEGNRLLRFTGDVTAGDFAFKVISDLATADVADIDDMSPGIANNLITDNPGLAIDTGRIHAFNFETGTGTEVAQGGTFGMHALGGDLFQDGKSRLFVLSSEAKLFELDPVTFASSPALVTGPTPGAGVAGWSGLTGPLTNCKTGFQTPT